MKRSRQAIKKFDYHPNAHAQSLALGRSKMIGLLVSDISNPFFPEIIKSIEAAVFASGYNLILLNTNYETERAVEYVQRLIQMKVAGIILMIAEFDPSLLDEAKRKKTSIVFHDLGTVGEGMSNIILDYASGSTRPYSIWYRWDTGILPILRVRTRSTRAGYGSRLFWIR